MAQDETNISLEDLDRAPSSLPVPENIDWQQKYTTLMAQFSSNADELISLREINGSLRTNNRTRALLDELIVPFASKSYWFMCAYCTVVALMLLFHGAKWGFSLPDTVLGYLVGSTAVTVIGLVGMVLTGVFVGGGKK